MAVDLQAPFLPTQQGQGYVVAKTDPFTTMRRDELNAVQAYPPTMPPAFPVYVRYDGSGVGDENYNVGYKQLPVASGIINSWQAGRFEAPDVPVTHLPFGQAFASARFPRSQASNQPKFRSLRAPGINEGA